MTSSSFFPRILTNFGNFFRPFSSVRAGSDERGEGRADRNRGMGLGEKIEI
jgi:hypothetical protein